MQTIKVTLPIVLAAGLAAAWAFPAAAEEGAPRAAVVGQKLDSGLGELPHYRHWIDATGRAPLARLTVSGEKLDSGLGDLPHYRDWADPTGRQVGRADASTGTTVARR